jgi:lysophospholipase L1-like esterase
MPAATVTEIQNTSTGGANNQMTFTGTWSLQSTTAASGGSWQKSTTFGDTVTVQFTGRALYLLCTTTKFYGAFTLTIDGVAVPGLFSTTPASSSALGSIPTYYRILMPLARNLVDTTHTAVLTIFQTDANAGSYAGLGVDSFIVLSGARGTPTTGNYVPIGDSWTNGVGATQYENGYPLRVQQWLGQQLKRGITRFSAGAVNGACLFTIDATHVGGHYQALSTVCTNTPEFLTILYGVNDLRQTYQGGSVGDYLRQTHSLLCFLEDALDTTQVRVAIGTPGYISGGYLSYKANVSLAAVVGAAGSGIDAYEEAVRGVKQMGALFPWLRVADVYGAMGRRAGLVLPNAVGDFGLHPNDPAHGVIAAEMFGALMGTNLDATFPGGSRLGGR